MNPYSYRPRSSIQLHKSRTLLGQASSGTRAAAGLAATAATPPGGEQKTEEGNHGESHRARLGDVHGVDAAGAVVEEGFKGDGVFKQAAAGETQVGDGLAVEHRSHVDHGE